jgi:hypothetical protein
MDASCAIRLVKAVYCWVTAPSGPLPGTPENGLPSMSFHRRCYPCVTFVLVLCAIAAPQTAAAITCTMQGQMEETQRAQLVEASKKLSAAVQSGDPNAVRALTLASVAAQFEPIANTIQGVAPKIEHATITIDALYSLDASDLKPGQDEAQFFCASPTSTLHAEITIPQLPPGKYALALLHATGVQQPRQMGFLLALDGANWQLAGFFVKPLLAGGHDSVWYWTRAREFSSKGQKWNAYFFYTTAAYLASPVEFLNTANLEKLEKETAAVRPHNLPGAQPLQIKANGQVFSITNLHTDASLGGLDLVIRYTTTDTSDPVATRARNVELMKAMLTQYPELRDGFHGLWVFADASNQRPFGNELPMSEIH